MSRWDSHILYIFAVDYAKEKKHIDRVYVYQPNTGTEGIWLRQKIISFLADPNNQCNSFYGMGRLPKSSPVRVYMWNDQHFIKTKDNDTKADNLGELPEIAYLDNVIHISQAPKPTILDYLKIRLDSLTGILDTDELLESVLSE